MQSCSGLCFFVQNLILITLPNNPIPMRVSKANVQENVTPELKQSFAYTASLSAHDVQAASLIVFSYD